MAVTGTETVCEFDVRYMQYVSCLLAWNSLSVNTRSADSFASFKRRLKLELFASTYAI